MKKLIGLSALLLVLLISLSACGSSDVSTGGSGNSTEKKEESPEATKEVAKEEVKEEAGKLIDATSNTKEALGLKIGLGEIKIAEDKISVGINVENTTDKMLMFYPDQGTLVAGDMQLDANMFMTSGSIGGDIHGGVKQEAVLEFLPPEGKTIDPNTITEIKLIFGDVMTEDFMSTEPVEFIVPVQ